MKISLENQHREKSAANNAEMSEQKLQQRLEQKYRPRPYSERWSKARLAALFISFAGNSFSFLTGAAALTFFAYLQFKHLAPVWLILMFSGILSVLLAGCLELLKRNSSANLFRIGFAENAWSISNGLGLLGFMAVSIGLSFWMSTQIPNLISPAPNLPTAQLESIEAIDQRYQEAIKVKQDAIDEFKKKGTSHWRYNGLENAITELEQAQIEERKAAIERNEQKQAALDKANAKRLEAHQNKNDNNASLLGYVTIASELFFLFSMVYVEWYDWKCLLERIEVQARIQDKEAQILTPKEEETINTEDKPTEVTKEIIKEEQPQQRTIIQGFIKQANGVDLKPKIDPDLSPQTSETVQEQVKTNNTMKTLPKLVNTSDFSTETVSGNSSETVVVGVIQHINERTGEEEELTQKEVSKRLNTYCKRVNATLEELKNCEDPHKKNRLKETLTRRTRKLKYWKGKLSQFKTIESL